MLKLIKMIVLLFNFSYFIGFFWIIILNGFEKFLNNTEPIGETYDEQIINEGFLKYYQFDDDTKFKQLIIGVYFAFTSLSTVGLGDYCPRSNNERIIGSALLLFGVSIFSYIMGNLLESFNKIVYYNDSLDEGEELSKFFGVLESFNF